MTYGELDCRASQLAHHLKGLGVGPDVLVGLFVERSAEMIVGLLGILKAGGLMCPWKPRFLKSGSPSSSRTRMSWALRREIERLRTKIAHLFKLNPHRDVSGTMEEFIEGINDRAFLAYKPVIYPAKMTICKPRRNYAFLRDPFNGWGGIAAGGLEIIQLPSDPGGIFIEPYVQTLAEKLKEQIDQAASIGAEIPDPPEAVLK